MVFAKSNLYRLYLKTCQSSWQKLDRRNGQANYFITIQIKATLQELSILTLVVRCNISNQQWSGSHVKFVIYLTKVNLFVTQRITLLCARTNLAVRLSPPVTRTVRAAPAACSSKWLKEWLSQGLRSLHSNLSLEGKNPEMVSLSLKLQLSAVQHLVKPVDKTNVALKTTWCQC